MLFTLLRLNLKMKNLSIFRFFLVIFFLFSINNYSQWTSQNPVPDGNTLRSVFFINDNTGWTVGSEGFITKTTNSGIDWIQQNTGTNANLKSVKFIDENYGWVVGEDGTILMSIDGGINWTNQNSNTNATLNSVDFFDTNIGWATGYNGTILRTTNGGNNWISVDSLNISDPIFSVNFVDENTGWAVGGNPYLPQFSSLILKTTDSGVSWLAQNSEIDNALYSVDFVDQNIGYAVGTENVVLKTTDGGETWIEQYNFVFSEKSNSAQSINSFIDGVGGLRSVFFKDANNGWAAGGENEYSKKLYSTTNGGITWDLKYYGSEEWDFFSIFMTEGGNGWAVGDGGSIFISNDDGKSWIRQFSGSGCCNADDINSIFFIDENTGWAAGKRNNWINGNGLLLKTTNSGKSWITQFTDEGETLKSVYFINNQTGWAVGDNILFTIDGGQTWSESLHNLEIINSVYFTDASVGFIASSGENSGIYKSTDGGHSWELKNYHGGNSIFFIDSNIGWAVGFNGLIQKTTNSGETWIRKSSGTSENLNKIVFYNSKSWYLCW